MAWLGARSLGGRMVMRVEDLDPRANNRERAEQLMADLAWLGLDWDEGPYYQSDRLDVYEDALRDLKGLGLTYPCFCTRAELHAATAPHASDGTYLYQGTCRDLGPQEVARRSALRPPATRVMVPEADDPAGMVAFRDLGYGAQREILAQDCGDFLLRRSDGVVAYQLAVVVDDGEMGVTQVVRGRDLLGSAARQTWLARTLGYQPPEFGHVPLLVAPDGRRLSKRDRDLDLGVLREQLGDGRRVVSMLASHVGLCQQGELLHASQLVERFSWDAIAAHRADIVMG
jgi:glutamyl-tRNA synthetase